MNLLYILVTLVIVFIIVIFILIKFNIFKKIKLTLFSGNGYFFHNSYEATSLLNKGTIKYDNDKKSDKIKMKDISDIEGKKEKEDSPDNTEQKNDPEKNKELEKIPQIKVPIKKIKENKPVNTIEKPLDQEKEKKVSQKEKIKGIIPKLNDKNIIAILEYITDNNYSLTNLVISDKLDINKEFLDILRNQIIGFLKDRLDNIKSDLTQLRKKGIDMSYLSMKIMSVPLKIKMFEASFDKQDFFKITEILDSLEKDLKAYNLKESQTEDKDK